MMIGMERRRKINDTIEPTADIPPEIRAERNLRASIIAHAFLDLQPTRPQSARQDAFDYLMGWGIHCLPHYADYPFRMTACCEACGFDVDVIRGVAKERFYHPSKFAW